MHTQINELQTQTFYTPKLSLNKIRLNDKSKKTTVNDVSNRKESVKFTMEKIVYSYVCVGVYTMFPSLSKQTKQIQDVIVDLIFHGSCIFL